MDRSGLVALKAARLPRDRPLSVTHLYQGKCVGRMTAPDVAGVKVTARVGGRFVAHHDPSDGKHSAENPVMLAKASTRGRARRQARRMARPWVLDSASMTQGTGADGLFRNCPLGVKKVDLPSSVLSNEHRRFEPADRFDGGRDTAAARVFPSGPGNVAAKFCVERTDRPD